MKQMKEAVYSNSDGKRSIIRIRVKPKSGRTKVTAGIEDGFILAFLKSSPEGGKANKELIKELAKALGLSSSQIKIIKGAKSWEKYALIETELQPVDVIRRLMS